MRRHQLDARARRDWRNLRLDLDQLARYYKVSWRSDTWVNSQRAGLGGYAANRLTGAYRLDQARCDDPATVADRVTRGLPGGEHQRHIRLRDGRASNFAGYLESVRTTSGETVRVDNEGRAQDDNSQTNRTVTRTGIGAAVGAVIGAIVGGGKGAAIGAAVGAGAGAGAGAGSVYVQGREDLDLMSGAEFTIRASAHR